MRPTGIDDFPSRDPDPITAGDICRTVVAFAIIVAIFWFDGRVLL